MTTKEEDNFLRIIYLNFQVATPALRSYFDSKHPNLVLDLSFPPNKTVLLDLYKPPPRKKKLLNQGQWSILYPPPGSNPVSSENLDVTLMVCLLRNLPPTVSPPTTGFDILPHSSDKTDGAHIARIKYYKNEYVSHSKDGKLSDADFARIWGDLEMAIYGLGNQQHVSDAVDAKSKVLDYESVKKLRNYDDIIYQRLELEACNNQENRKILNDHAIELAEHRTKILKLETPVHNMETEDFSDLMITKLDQWKEDEAYFVETTASNHVMRCLLDNKCVSVVGSSGVGKTFLVQHVALKMQQMGYTIICANEPNDIKENYKLSRKTLFVVDDMCGNFTANTERLDEWKKSMKDITAILDHDSHKLILTCRIQVFHDEGFKHSRLQLFQTCVCNLADKKLALTLHEKDKISEKYFEDTLRSKLTVLYQYDFFPLLCKLYVKNKDKPKFSLKNFLKNPFEWYETELNDLFFDCKEGKHKIVALLFLVICDNQLEKKWLAGKDDRVQEILDDILEVCDIIERLTGKRVISELNTLMGTFVSIEKDVYHAIHDKLFDFLAYYFGTKNEVTNTEYTGLLIKHAGENFIGKRCEITYPGQLNDTTCTTYVIAIQKDYIPSYIERVFSDMKNSDDIYNCLKNNINEKNITFQTELCNLIEHLDKDKLSKLIDTASAEFICEMFVNDRSSICKNKLDGYERYRIILHNDHLQQYIARMFDDITKSDNVEHYMRRSRCCRNKLFRSALLTYMSNLSPSKIANLVQDASKSFVQVMFVMAEEDINRRSLIIYKRYGIKISGDLIQSYKIRIFKEIVTCIDVQKYFDLCRCSRNKEFNTVLQRYMIELSSNQIAKHMNIAGTSFLQRMFVMKEEDIKQSSFLVYERYGIKINEDLMHIYIGILFKEIEICDHVVPYIRFLRCYRNQQFKTAFQSYVNKMPTAGIIELVKNASSSFIQILHVMMEEEGKQINPPVYTQYGIKIPYNVIHVYMERVLDDLSKSNDVEKYLKCNINITTKIFQKELQAFIRQLDRSKIEYLIKTSSEDFINRLCVIQIDKTKDNFCCEYERYGVIIPEDCIQLYVARWFDGLTKSSNTEYDVRCNRNKQTQLFKRSLRTYMEQLPEDEIGRLIQTASRDFLHKWFVTTSEDINENSIKEYEQYGIIIQGKNLQLYNEMLLTFTFIRHYIFIDEMKSNRTTKSILKYIRGFPISTITDIINTASEDVFHNMITVDIANESKTEKIHSDSQFLNCAIRNIFEKKEGLVICPNILINQYMDRMTLDWDNGKISAVINNKNLENQAFVEKFQCHLNLLEPFKISELLQMKEYRSQDTALTLCCKFGRVNLAKWCLENHLHVHPKQSSNQLCALLLLVVFNDELEEDLQHDKLTNVIMCFKQMHDIQEDLSVREVKEELDGSMNWIIVKKRGVYHAVNREVFDFLVFYLASTCQMSTLLVEYADEKVIYERFLVENSDSNKHFCLIQLPDKQLQTCMKRIFTLMINSEKLIRNILGRWSNIKIKLFTHYILKLNEQEIKKIIENACIYFINKMFVIKAKESKYDITEESEIYIEVPRDSIDMYIKRIFDYMSNSDCVEACLQENRNKKNEMFYTQLSTFIKGTNINAVKKLINQASSDFTNRMFVMSAVDIKDESCWEYERYGIIVPNELLQMYIQRVFSDMTQSDYVPVNRNSENKTFQENLNSYINALPEDKLTSLIQTASSTCISRMHLSTKEIFENANPAVFENEFMFVPKKYARIFRKKLPTKLESPFEDRYKNATFAIENDSVSFIIHFYEDTSCDNVLITISRTSKTIENLEHHLVKYIDPFFISKKIRCCVRSTNDLESKYIQRMLDDWIEGKVHEVFGNINLSNKHFECEFLTNVRNTGNVMQAKLAKTNDTCTGDSPLTVCSYVGISQLTEWCLVNNANTNSYNNYNEHALYKACIYNRHNIVCRLLDQANKTDINAHVCNKTLYKACECGFKEIVLRLLEETIDVNGSYWYPATPLFIACKHGHVQIVSILLDQKADEIDINKGKRHSLYYGMTKTPLYIACKGGHIEIVSLLLTNLGIDVNMHTYNLETPLYAASEGGYTDIVSLLLKHESQGINKARSDGTTSLFVASRKGHAKVVSVLLNQKGILIDECMLTGMSPLFIASLLGHTRIVEMLLSNNGDANICFKNKTTVKYEFKQYRKRNMFSYGKILGFKQRISKFEELFTCIKWLIRDNVSEKVNLYLNELKKDCVSNLFFGSSPLHIGSTMGHIDIVKLLVNATSDINCLNETGCTPLLLACELGHEEIVHILFENGANPTMERTDGKSPISIAREKWTYKNN
ncbi:unnamed protein product [Mytilus coruscus]|uniref:Uncharacterized protein n=1 Tax=Mytilus coruscus TaxID=42192 RepID=A0A6J8CWJ5_MYTCO|nr:unnamed protein product [Mytilus coruscus]